MEREKEPVALIPADTSINAIVDVIKALTSCYPTRTLQFTNDAVTGGVLIFYYSDETNETIDTNQLEATLSVASITGTELTSLFDFVFSGHEDTVTALSSWLISVLEAYETQNYITFTIAAENGKKYAMTIQHCDGLTPAEKISELQQTIVDFQKQ